MSIRVGMRGMARPPSRSPPWALQDFTTYTEVDTVNDRIQKTANHVDHVATRNEDTYLYKDFGAGAFTDFTHKIDAKSDFVSAYSWGAFWMLANAFDDCAGLIASLEDVLFVNFYQDVGAQKIVLFEICGGVAYFDQWLSAVADTWYYITIAKTGTAFTCEIYSDAARTAHVHTLSLTLQVDYSFRYLYPCNSYNDGSGVPTRDSDIENLIIST